MIAYLLVNCILLFKLFLFILIKIFLIPNLFSKYIIIIIFTFFLYLCYKYPRYNILIKQDLFEYALKTKKALIYNILIILIYTNVFIIGIFYLRYLNMEKKIDLRTYQKIINKFFNQFTLQENIINIFIIILFIVFYIAIMYKFTQYYKLHVIKRHIYLVNSDYNYNRYEKFHDKFLYPFNIHTVYGNLLLFITEAYEKYYFNKRNKPYPKNYHTMSLNEQNIFNKKTPVSPFAFLKKYKIRSILYHLLTKWHHILLFIIIFYDILNNDYIIQHIFVILPWIFFYELYIRISQFLNGLWIPYDQALRRIIYSNKLEKINEDTLSIDGDFQDLSFYKNMYKHYIMRGFIKDDEHV